MYYWVNQGKTFKEEKEGGYLWAPVENNEGRSFFHWENMKKLRPGDIVFNYRKGYLISYSIIQSESYLAPQPEEFSVDVEWEDEGYMADADYYMLKTPISVESIYEKIANLLPSKYSPITSTNDSNSLQVKANQGYLYALSDKLGEALADLVNVKVENDSPKTEGSNVDDSTDYKVPDKTSRKGLVTSRVGQGEYRRRILRRWNNRCAVNGSTVKEILIASHIVAWRDSDDHERLDIDNGILLSPVYDALFDRHLISFDDEGRIVLSNTLSKADFLTFGIDGTERIENLNSGNKKYLKRHREKLVKL